jgi:hypothetical protein
MRQIVALPAGGNHSSGDYISQNNRAGGVNRVGFLVVVSCYVRGGYFSSLR